VPSGRFILGVPLAIHGRVLTPRQDAALWSLRRWCRVGAVWGVLIVVSAATGAAGCTGLIGDDGDGQDDPGTSSDALGSPDFRRLSPLEVEQTIADTMAELGVAAQPDALLIAPPDVRHTFSTTADSGNFTSGQVQNIMAWAESVSEVVGQDVAGTLGCTPGPTWDDCASDFASRLGRLAFRRPLDADDLDTFRAVYDEVMLQPEAPSDGVRAMVELAFQSPDFWYLSNETRPDSRQLTSHAIAGRLSYYLWGTMPDATLRELADSDELQTAEQIRAQAERLLDDPRAETVITRFHREWLHVSDATSLTKDATLYPDFDADLAADMDREFDLYVQRNVSEGTVEELLSSNEGFVNARLESFYELSSSSSGPDDWVWRPLGEERAGILSRPLFLANTAGLGESSLIHRGVAVIENYFCQTLEVPADVSDEAVVLPPDASSGKLAGVDNRASKPQCAACHNTIDPIGLSFESFDAIGAYRTSYPDGVSIDPAGDLQPGIAEEAVSYNSSAELISSLAGQPQVQACYASKWLEWSTGRRPTAAQKLEVERVSQTGQLSIRALLLEVAVSPLLIQREDF
jgi:Protein of unknown function (DUF1592)/Protein of unknown function (DUF1588)/Protein of unknown function (DUF1595)/Protein of unknown function (DUF1585)